jgi:hypothetical protein
MRKDEVVKGRMDQTRQSRTARMLALVEVVRQCIVIDFAGFRGTGLTLNLKWGFWENKKGGL